ncbi:MAG TPA: hypothetical protein VNW99_03505 [Cytophagaceae bacterium]|jgi:hypothetical protein|nr:hypothetical protein [Cytophagaceae bacterium]
MKGKPKSISRISKLKGSVKFDKKADYKKELSTALKNKYSE